MKYSVCMSLWLLAAGVAQADTRAQLNAAGQRLEAELAECYDRVDFEAADAKRQADLCDFEIPSASVVDSTSGPTFDTQIMAPGKADQIKGTMKWSLALSCYENKITTVAFIADAAENMRHDEVNGKRYAKTVEVTFEKVAIKTGQE